jgi:hypothetical protein
MKAIFLINLLISYGLINGREQQKRMNGSVAPQDLVEPQHIEGYDEKELVKGRGDEFSILSAHCKTGPRHIDSSRT